MHPFYKLNTDGSCLNNPEKGPIEGVIKNSRGGWEVGFAKHFPDTTNNQMEFIALLEGLRIAEAHQ